MEKRTIMFNLLNEADYYSYKIFREAYEARIVSIRHAYGRAYVTFVQPDSANDICNGCGYKERCRAGELPPCPYDHINTL